MLSPEHLIREEVLALCAYDVPDSSGMVKLDAMENPYPLPAAASAEIAKAAANLALNRYPDPTPPEFKRTLKAAMGVPESMDILLGNGSDEIIQIIALALAKPDAVMMSVEPSFVMYRRSALTAGMRYIAVPLERDFTLDPDRLSRAVAEYRPAVLFLAFPNNPTGNLFDRAAVLQVMEAHPGLTVLDEAYYPFAQATFMDELERRANLLVMRTFSKLGLAGLRLGLVAGRGEWLVQLEKLRLPYNVSTFTQVAAQIALRNAQALTEQARTIRADRDALLAELGRGGRVEVFDSHANFILFKLPGADDVFSALKARGILIKNLNRSHPMLQNCLRVTIGSANDNRRFLTALQEILNETG